MMKWLSFSVAMLAALCVGWLSDVPQANAQGQPAQWNYSNVNGIATANYPGNVTVNGTINGGSGGGGGLNFANSFSLKSAVSLSSACGLAGLTGYVYIDTNVTLTANTVLNCNVYAAGGIISLAGFNLNIIGRVDGPRIQVFNVGTSISVPQLTIAQGDVLFGQWLCGQWGSITSDYSPCIQAGINIIQQPQITGTPNVFNGPRVLDLQGVNVAATSIAGILLENTVTYPANSAGGTVLASGQHFLMRNGSGAGGINTPAFIMPQVINSAWLCEARCTFDWTGAQPTAAQTQADVFVCTYTAGGDGCFNNTFAGIGMTGGWGVLYSNITTPSVLPGFWAGQLRNVLVQGEVGTAIYQNIAGERENYDNIQIENFTSATLPAIQICGGEQSTFNGLSIDGYGTTGTPATSDPIVLSAYNGVFLSTHFENVFMSTGHNLWNISSSTTSPGGFCVGGSQAQVSMINQTWDVNVAASASDVGINVSGGSIVSSDQLIGGPITIGSGGSFRNATIDTTSLLFASGNSVLTTGTTLGDYQVYPEKTFANSGTCNALTFGRTIFITDSTTATFLAPITTGGGGSSVVARCNGTNYVVSG